MACWKDKCDDKLFWHIKNKKPKPPWGTAAKTVRNSSILLTTWEYTMITNANVTPTLLITYLITPYVNIVPLHHLYLALPHTLLTCTTFTEKRSETLLLHYLHYIKHNKGWVEVVHTHPKFLTFIGRSVCVLMRGALDICVTDIMSKSQVCK